VHSPHPKAEEGKQRGEGAGETQFKSVKGVRNGVWVCCGDVAWKSYQHTLEMMLAVEGMVWEMAHSKVRVKEQAVRLGAYEGVWE